MAFATLSLDDEHAFLLAHHKRLNPLDDVNVGSFHWLRLRTFAAGVTDNGAHIEAVKTDVMPDTATGDMADRWGGIKGLKRKGATAAHKDNVLRVTGTVGTTVPDKTVYVHTSGLQFQTRGPDVVGAAGYVDCDLTALSTGSATRLAAGETLTVIAGISGLNDAAELQLALDEDGVDAETDSDYVARYLARFSSPPLGGAQADYVDWALQTTGIAAAYCYPLRAGLGTVDLAALHGGSGATRVLLAGEVTALQTAMNALRPVSVKAFRVLTVVPATQNVEYTVVSDGAAEHVFDWDDTIPPTCLVWTLATRTLQFAGGSRPSTLKAGDRVSFSDGATGQERVVESLSGADSVVLEVPAVGNAGDVPTSGVSIVYAGGPLVQLVRLAILGLIDGLGTANPDATRYGAWEGNLRPTAIGRVATGVDGVLDGTVVTPGATVVASDLPFPDDGTIGLIIHGRVLARAAH